MPLPHQRDILARALEEADHGRNALSAAADWMRSDWEPRTALSGERAHVIGDARRAAHKHLAAAKASIDAFKTAVVDALDEFPELPADPEHDLDLDQPVPGTGDNDLDAGVAAYQARDAEIRQQLTTTTGVVVRHNAAPADIPAYLVAVEGTVVGQVRAYRTATTFGSTEKRRHSEWRYHTLAPSSASYDTRQDAVRALLLNVSVPDAGLTEVSALVAWLLDEPRPTPDEDLRRIAARLHYNPAETPLRAGINALFEAVTQAGGTR